MMAEISASGIEDVHTILSTHDAMSVSMQVQETIAQFSSPNVTRHLSNLCQRQ